MATKKKAAKQSNALNLLPAISLSNFPTQSIEALTKNLDTNVKDVTPTLSNVIEFVPQESGQFRGWANRVANDPTGNKTVSGIVQQSGASFVAAFSAMGDISFSSIPKGYRFILKKILLTIKDDDNSLDLTYLKFYENTTHFRFAIFTSGTKMIDIPLEPIITFDTNILVRLEAYAGIGTPAFTAGDVFIIYLHGFFEEI
jgi:hypothetical protein